MWKFFIIFPFSPTGVQGVSRYSKQTIGRPQKPLRLLNRSTCSREDVQRPGCRRSSTAARPSTLQVSRIGPGTLRNSDPTNFLSLTIKVPFHPHAPEWKFDQRPTEEDQTKTAWKHHMQQRWHLKRERNCSSGCFSKVIYERQNIPCQYCVDNDQ